MFVKVMKSPEVPDEGPCSPASTRKTRSTVRSRIWSSTRSAVALMLWKPRSVVDFIWKAGTLVGAKWERAFVLSCIAVSLDPLFLYIPIVDEANKCLNVDKTLRTTALVLRTLTDFLLVTHIVAEIRQRIHDQKVQTENCLSTNDYLSTDKYLSTNYPKYLFEDPNPHSDKEFDPDPEALRIYQVKSFVETKLPWFTPALIIKLLAIIPVPQLAILVGFFRMTGSDFYKRKFLNVALVLQYLPRVCQIYLTKKHFRMGGKWPQPLFNLYLYILAGHVLGSLWYFVAIQRETSCWHKACKQITGCVVASTYHCGGNGSTKNITFLNQLCPINSPNSTQFDFGIFVDILQSGSTESDKFATKLFYSFWWGLKNLSNFGTNLQTSSYIWENCFAILICVIGLLLFLYLIGNVQLYFQSATQNSLKKEKSRTAKVNATYNDITKWMNSRFKVGNATRKKIKKAIRKDKLVEKNLFRGVDVDVNYFLKLSSVKQSVLEHVGMEALQKVPMLRDLDDTKLRSLSQKMKPVVHNPNTANNHFVILGGELDKILFFIEGNIQVSNNGTMPWNYYRKEILEWVSFNTGRSYRDPLPRSTESVEPYINGGKVEALALDAWELLDFLDGQKFDINNNNPEAKELADSYKKKLKDACNKSNHHDEGLADQWISPEPGWVKLNWGYVKRPNTKEACFGFVLRNDKHDYIAAGADAYNESVDIFEAGALSIQRYLRSSIKCMKTISQIVVESDDKLLMDFIRDGLSDKKRVRDILRPTLQNIDNDIRKFNHSEFVDCKRQANEEALLVAGHASVSGSKDWKNDEDIQQLVDTSEKDGPRPKQNQDLAQKANDNGASTSAGVHKKRNVIGCLGSKN